ncbi:DUF4232 domain-containing protein [Streptomyces sp. NPDC048018]|uniref:DUF4232 domain-containing protein n=1 Tax=Streptomyces sp. NPDC048018 TaxID=3365499 RepID=UPI00371E7980
MSTVRRAAALAAAAAVSSLALTACGPSEDGAAGAPTAPATPTKSAAPTPSAKPTSTPGKGTTGGSTGGSTGGTSGGSTGGSAGGSTGGATGGSGGPTDPDYDVFPCSTFDVTFTASLAEPTTSSYLLKITNKSGKPCKALGHPVVTFGDLDGQATERGKAPDIEKAIRLAPGESAYAGLMGGAKDGKGKTVNSIALTMSTESDLEQKPLKASTPGFNVSPTTNSVTAWMTNAEDALSL